MWRNEQILLLYILMYCLRTRSCWTKLMFYNFCLDIMKQLPDLWSGQTPWWNWYLTPLVNFGEVRRVLLAKSTFLTSKLVSLGSFQIFSGLFRCYRERERERERERDAEGNGKLLHISILSETATLVPEFAVEDLPLGRIAALLPEFAVKDLPLGRTL